MEKVEKKKINFLTVVYIIIAGLFVLYCVDTISYSIQVKGYNECLGAKFQGEAIGNGLTNVGKSSIIVANKNSLLLRGGASYQQCLYPSRIFGE